MGFRETAKKIKDKLTKPSQYVYDMSTKEAREMQVKHDYEYAKTEKAEITSKFIELNNYYNNKHYSQDQLRELASKRGWTFVPPVLPDPYIQVESQIDPEIPQFQFKGRDDDLDSAKAKQRQQVVEFVVDNNDVEELNLDNERSLNELGNASWKVSFDGSIKGPGFIGEIVIGNPDPANIFPDPSAYDIDDCEWIIYAFRMHRRKARRIYGEIVDEITNDNSHSDTEIYENTKKSVDDDTLLVIEYWYRDDEGDVACSTQINNIEVKHIPKYWINTAASGNKLFPFVKYGKIPVRKAFWDKGEIEAIKDLVDAADREFMDALMNDSFAGNDIILEEEGAFADNFVPTALPGARWKVKQNKINAVKRLGGLKNSINSLPIIEFIHSKIQETNGNFATKGAEPQRVTTAIGLAQLREDRNARETIKKAGRLQGFKRLYELIDWTALEFYNQNRMILVRGKKEGEPDTSFPFNSNNIRVLDGAMTEQTMEPTYYYPKIDTVITAGDGIKQSKAFTLAATQELAKLPITPENKGIVMSIIDILDLPNKKELKESIETAIPSMRSGGIPPEVEQFLQTLPPEVLDMVMSLPPEEQMQQVQTMMQVPPEELQMMIDEMLGGGMGEAV